jgi:hypothetical protein
MANVGQSRLPFVAAGVLALVALAAFLILDLADGSVDPSALPVIQIGQGGDSLPGQNSTQPGQLHQGQGFGGATSTTAPGSAGTQGPQTNGPGATVSAAGTTTTGSTVRETINGGVRTGGTGSGGGSVETGAGGDGGGVLSTGTTGGR